MIIDLTDRVALVTGSTLGIGFATAAGLHAAGATVVINGRSQERLDAALKRLGGGGRDRHPHQQRRLTSPEEVANLIVYLASEEASATTGAAMRVDGGIVRAVA